VPPTPFDELSLAALRQRRSAKWTRYSPDVLPAWVAEMDFPLAPAVRDALLAAVERDDVGYAVADALPEAFADFAHARWGWSLAHDRSRLFADIMSAVEELLRALTRPGDGVVINPPVYPPFFSTVREVGREVVEAPLRDGRLDLDALERAFASDVAAYLLCSPHNPTGTVFTRAELSAVAELAAARDVLVISDEVHAPMTLAGTAHTPYLTVSEHGVALASASKAWNVAGLKSALAVVDATDLSPVPAHVSYHAGHLGVLASIAAFTEGRDWLDALVVHLDVQRRRLAELLETQLPQVGYVPPQAGYLAWLDCRALELGDDPSAAFLERGRVALSPGPTFGAEGTGFARLNIGTSGGLLAEAVSRMRSALDG
jgi:cysteine-S-conjugate beta-lyase